MGTLVRREGKGSRSIGIAVHGEVHTLELRLAFDFVPSSGSDPFPGYAWAVAQSVVPKVRTRLETAIHENDPYLKAFVCRGIAWEQEEASPYSIVARVHYTQRLTMDGKPFVRVTRTPGTRATPMWRRGASRPGSGIAAWPPTADIGGAKVDINGAPRTHDVPQQTILLEHQWDRTQPISGSPAGEPPASILTTFGETRNSDAIFGWPAGSLLYKGFSQSPDQELYTLTHTWVADGWEWLEQYPVPNAAGQPILASVASFSGVTVRQASNVVWLQRYPSLVDHRTIFDPAMWALILAELNTPQPTFI